MFDLGKFLFYIVLLAQIVMGGTMIGSAFSWPFDKLREYGHLSNLVDFWLVLGGLAFGMLGNLSWPYSPLVQLFLGLILAGLVLFANYEKSKSSELTRPGLVWLATGLFCMIPPLVVGVVAFG